MSALVGDAGDAEEPGVAGPLTPGLDRLARLRSPQSAGPRAGHSNQNAELAAMTLAGSVLQVVCGVADGSVVYGHLGIE